MQKYTLLEIKEANRVSIVRTGPIETFLCKNKQGDDKNKHLSIRQGYNKTECSVDQK